MKTIMNTKKILTAIIALATGLTTQAQTPSEGVSYYLPKTALKIHLLVEKTSFTPGSLARYSERYLKNKVNDKPSTEYRIVGVDLSLEGLPDSAKYYEVAIDKKRSIINISRSSNGVLTAINAKPITVSEPAPFKPAPKVPLPNPNDYMTEDILTAGSSAKMAELIAREIYDIRDSRNQLNRGEADFMPKDGEQLKIMLNNLATQEKALLQVFDGVTQRDTTEEVITVVPDRETTQVVLCRFSTKLGLLDVDDLSGAPYLLYIEDQKLIPELKIDNAEAAKKTKEDIGVNVNQPGKIKVTILKEEQPLKTFEVWAAQFGREESLSANMFGKKFTTHLQLNPVTGNVESLEVEPLE